MKLGYLFVPPAQRQARQPGSPPAMRAGLAAALGFSEFYAPLAHADESCGPHATERRCLLQILPDRPAALRPKLVMVNGEGRAEGAPSAGPLAAPVVRAADVRTQSARGHMPLSVSWSDADMLARHWAAHVTGCTHSGRCARQQDWRVARTVIVDPDAARAEAMAKAADSPCRAYYRASLPAGADDAEVDARIDACVLHGTLAGVMEQLQALTEASAAFGTLTLVDHDWPDATRARRSMRLLAEAIHSTHHSQTHRTIRKIEHA